MVVYLPPAAEVADEVGLVVALDGGAYDALVSTPATVEALTDEGAIPPAIAVMVHSADRNRELPPNRAFTSFVADTLLPALRARYPVSGDPARNVIVGSSLGGLAAAWLGYRLPSVFGNVVAQSGAYWWSPPGGDGAPWLPWRYAVGEVEPLRLWVEAGALETQPVRGGVSMLRLTQHFRDVLCARGYEVSYSTFPGGHEYENWRATLPQALTWIFSGEPGDSGTRCGRSGTEDERQGRGVGSGSGGPCGTT